MTIEQQIAAAERELAMRRGVYPRWVAAKKMTQQKSDHEIATMAAIVETLKVVQSNPSAAAAIVAQYRTALEQCVRVAKAWHGEDAFDLYFNHSPEMHLIRALLGKMPETTA